MVESGSPTWDCPVSIDAQVPDTQPGQTTAANALDQPLVSVVIIFLDEERFLREAIDSVFGQTYTRWELLLVDDGSTDASTRVARQCAEENPGRVYYVEHASHRNRGMSASRNLGCRHSRGEYIAFLDADDVWLPAKLERQLALLRSWPTAAMVCGPVQWWYSWTGDRDDVQRDVVIKPSFPMNTLLSPPQLVVRLLQQETVTTTSGLLRRDAIERVGGFEETFRGLYEDQAFCAKLCLKAPVFVADECWYRWRKHPDSSCAVAVRTGQYEDARATFLRWLKGYLVKQEVTDSTLWNILQKELWRSRHPYLVRVLTRLQRTGRKSRKMIMKTARRVLPAAVQRRLQVLRHGSPRVP